MGAEGRESGKGREGKTERERSRRDVRVGRQFVRVMLNMAHDLGFFGIIWGILILSFRCESESETPCGWVRARARAFVGGDGVDGVGGWRGCGGLRGMEWAAYGVRVGWMWGAWWVMVGVLGTCIVCVWGGGCGVCVVCVYVWCRCRAGTNARLGGIGGLGLGGIGGLGHVGGPQRAPPRLRHQQ